MKPPDWHFVAGKDGPRAKDWEAEAKNWELTSTAWRQAAIIFAAAWALALIALLLESTR